MKKLEISKKGKIISGVVAAIIFGVISYKAGVATVTFYNAKYDELAVKRVMSRNLIKGNVELTKEVQVPVIEKAEVDKQITKAIQDQLK